LKKGTLWKVTKETTDIENEKLFARLRLISLNLRLYIKKTNIMHLPKRKKVRAKKNSKMNRSLHPCHRKC
jgi:hypothetical protein